MSISYGALHCNGRRFGDTYKWLLYGDDDTFFFDHALISTLQEMDPDMPYFLTGAHMSCIDLLLHETVMSKLPPVPSLLLTHWLRDCRARLVHLRAWAHMAHVLKAVHMRMARLTCIVYPAVYPHHVASPP